MKRKVAFPDNVTLLPTAASAKIRNNVRPARLARKERPWPKTFNPPWLREINERQSARKEYGELRDKFIELRKSPALLILMTMLPELSIEVQAKIARQIDLIHNANPSAASHDALLLIGKILAESAARAQRESCSKGTL